MEDTIVISSADLVECADLVRKKTETSFRRDFLMRKGANTDEEHMQALQKQLENIDEKLSPLEQKMAKVDMLSVIPNRAEINALTGEIEQHPKEKLDEALKTKQGEVYELLKKRVKYTKTNFEARAQIARLTILLNSLPRKEAQNLRTLVETQTSEVVDVSSLDEQRQKDLMDTIGRLGISTCLSSNKLSLEKSSEETAISPKEEVEKRYADVGGVVKTVWVAKDRENEWEQNEQKLSTTSRRIQVLITKSHAEPLTDGEQVEFEALQKEYIELKTKREEISSEESDVSVSLPLKKE